MLVHWNSIEPKIWSLRLYSNSPGCSFWAFSTDVFFVSSSVSCDAADSKGQPSDDCEEHWTQRSAYQAVKDPHQSSQAGWCRYYDKLSLILFFNKLLFFDNFNNSLLFDVRYLPPQSPLKKLIKKREELEEEPPEKEELDWWSRYYASLEELERKVSQKWREKIGRLTTVVVFCWKDHSSTT